MPLTSTTCWVRAIGSEPVERERARRAPRQGSTVTAPPLRRHCAATAPPLRRHSAAAARGVPLRSAANIEIALQLLVGAYVLWAAGNRLFERLREVRRQRSFISKMRVGMGEAPTRAAGRERMLDGFKQAVNALHDRRLIIDLEVQDVSFRLPNGTTVLSNVSASLPHGSVTALMGPSGCGKTTLMTLLSGKLRPSSGKLRHLLGGVACTPSQFRKLQARCHRG